MRKKMEKLIDISYPYDVGMVVYPGNPEFNIEKIRAFEKGDNFAITGFSLGSHTGTHIDAPAHMIEGGQTIDELPLEAMNGSAKVIDFTNKKDISAADIEMANIESDSIVLFKTDNSFCFQEDGTLDEYVTLTYDAAELLAKKNIKTVGVDYMTIERPKRKRVANKSVHSSLLSKGILIIETLNLKDVEAGDYMIHCFPLNIIGADGCPVRVVLERSEYI